MRYTLSYTKKQSSPATRHGGAWRKRRYSSYSLLTSALDGVSGQRHAAAALCPGERTPGTHCTGGWLGPRAGLDTEIREKNPLPLSGIEPRSPGRPVRCQTLYWLSYPGSTLSYRLLYLWNRFHSRHYKWKFTFLNLPKPFQSTSQPHNFRR
jgi:hypothetical protein